MRRQRGARAGHLRDERWTTPSVLGRGVASTRPHHPSILGAFPARRLLFCVISNGSTFSRGLRQLGVPALVVYLWSTGWSRSPTTKVGNWLGEQTSAKRSSYFVQGGPTGFNAGNRSIMLFVRCTVNELTSWRRLRACSAWPCLAVA